MEVAKTEAKLFNSSSGFGFRAVSYMRLRSSPLDGSYNFVRKYNSKFPLKICVKDW